MVRKRKNVKIQKKKSLFVVLLEYTRTVSISFAAAFLFTILLSIHARSEMIKNMYISSAEQQKIDKQLAKELVAQSDFTKDLRQKNYVVCMQVGNLYESALDLSNAQIAFEFAIEKARKDNYTPHLALARVLTMQDKLDEAGEFVSSVKDANSKNLIKFKTRTYIDMGDRYYSEGKFLSAAKCYEKARFYYDKFSKKDKLVEKSLQERLVSAYLETADIMVNSSLNTDAVRYLTKAEKLAPDNFSIKYKLAIIYSDLDPIKSVEYFMLLMRECPQDIDESVYSSALMKAANIEELKGNSSKAKYYRYKIHSNDIFINQKVIYNNDLEVYLDNFLVKKSFFKYKLKAVYRIKNVSHKDIQKLSLDFVLRKNKKAVETVTVNNANNSVPLYSNGTVTDAIDVIFGKNIYTKRELENYVIDIYVYKDKKYKTLLYTMKVPEKTITKTNKMINLIPELSLEEL